MLRYLLLLWATLSLWGTEPSFRYGLVPLEMLHSSFAKHIPIKVGKKNLIGYLSFSQEYPLDELSFLYTKYAMQFFREKKVDFIVVHLDSFGGEMLPAIKIVDLFQKCDFNYGIPLMAWIDRYAIGSASLLAYACRYIAVSQKALMGGQIPGRGVSNFSEEMMDDFLSEYASIASVYGRNPILAEAMVDASIILVQRNGQLLQLYSPGDIITMGDTPDLVISPQNEWLTLDASQLLSLGIADFEVTTHGEPSFFQGPLISFHRSPLAEEPYLGTIPDAYLITYQNWKFQLLKIFTHPSFFAALIFIVLFSLYLQMHFKKFNISGFIGFIGLAFVLIQTGLFQEISWTEGLLLIFGFTLWTVRRVLTLQSLAMGWLGLGIIALSLVSLAIPGFDNFRWLNFEAHSSIARSVSTYLTWAGLSLTLVILGIWYTRFRYPTYFVHKIYGSEPFKELDKESSLLPKVDTVELPKENAEGFAHCTLRPFGKVIIRDKIYDAISIDHSVIFKKTPILVVGYQNGKLVVKEKKQTL
ncbi:MAG: hypothetical protein FJZ63_03510 [Chlamydiae bacterium]|nr:hypothetical protein [Chlamydiota bacterium]